MSKNYKIAIRKYSDITLLPNLNQMDLDNLIKIDKITCQYLDKGDFLKRCLNLDDEELDVYIIKQERDKTIFYDIIYNNTDPILIHFLNNAENKIKIDDSFLTSYIGKFIYRLKQDNLFKNYMEKIFPHLKHYFESFVENTILLNTIKYKNFLNKISDYNTIRKMIMCEKIYNKEIPNLYKMRNQVILPPKDDIKKREINVINRIKYIKTESFEDDDTIFLSEEEKEMMTGEGNSLYKSFY